MNWIKSTKCDGGTCIEVAWAKSTKCEGGTCAEVAQVDDMIGVRNSQIPGEVVWFTPQEWTAFLAGVQDGEFRF
jgi:hypothetical protein